MSERTRLSALRAAAKVALGAGFSLGVWGCGASISEGDAANGASVSEAGGPSEDAPEVPQEAGLGERPSIAWSDASGTHDDQEADGAGPADAIYTAEASGDGQADAPSLDDAPTLACLGPVTLEPARGAETAYRAVTSAVTAEQGACCIAYNIAMLSDAGGAVPETAKGDPNFVNCCKAVIAGVENHTVTYASVKEPLRSACCFQNVVASAQDLYSVSLCTPWGPPVPPAMPGEGETRGLPLAGLA